MVERSTISIKERQDTKMKMADITSRTWTKVAEIPTDNFTDEGIAIAINKEFGEMLFEDVKQEIANGYIQICEDGIIVWGAWKEVDRHV